MDFTYHYTDAQESFRTEVSAWLDANLPHDLDDAVGQASKAPATDLRRLLGEKGWLAPTEPVEYGGIGASQGEEVILAEELDRRGLGWLLDRGTAALARALDRFGSQSQAMDLITAINQGKVSIWHTCIPPQDSRKTRRLQTRPRRTP
ncbi:MAG: acyl-CoA dehydrogenase family protein [Chloroflexi bacterium]|nr:acyl-CoA dehydrogenase family protein [Chloroflexota bacterium]